MLTTSNLEPEINYVCSLGNMCHSNEILKRNNLKTCSYPFDWIYSSIDIVIHSIEDNFNIFLDKSYYIDFKIKWTNRQCGHSLYHYEMFNHYDPRNEKDHNYYIRCVNRFKSLLQKQEHKLFTMMFINNNNSIDETFMNDIIVFNNKLSKYTNNYTLLVIYHIPYKKQNHHTFVYHDNIHFLELHTLSRSGGVLFDNKNTDNNDNDDNIYLDNILNSNYKFNIMPLENAESSEISNYGFGKCGVTD